MKFRIKGFIKLYTALALAATIFLALPAAAEGPNCKRGKRSPEQRVQRLQSELQLSDDQAAQVKAIFEAHQSEFQRIKGEMKQTLTDDQRQAMKENRKQRRASGEGKPSKEERRQRMAELGVSDGQMQQLKSLRQQMKSERKMIGEELRAVLTPEQLERFEQMKSERKQRKRGQRA